MITPPAMSSRLARIRIEELAAVPPGDARRPWRARLGGRWRRSPRRRPEPAVSGGR